MNDEMKLVDGWWTIDQRAKRDETKAKNGHGNSATDVVYIKILFFSVSFYTF